MGQLLVLQSSARCTTLAGRGRSKRRRRSRAVLRASWLFPRRSAQGVFASSCFPAAGRFTPGSCGFRWISPSSTHPVVYSHATMASCPGACSRARQQRLSSSAPRRYWHYRRVAVRGLFWQKQKTCLTAWKTMGILITAVNDSAYSGWVAQLVEQRTENPRVRGSIPFPATL